MKPRFALDLTNEAVSLLERGADGWVRLGEAAFDAEDFDARLAALKDLARARAPEGFTSKLILPNSQILYFDCQITGPDQATRRAEIRAALDGRTPYPLSELVFDFSRSGNRARVAVVAGVTLDEAEAFADANGFNPVAFVAAPEPDRFAGEPFFGPTSVVSNYLADGVRLDRDQDPVRVVADLSAAVAPHGDGPGELSAAAPETGAEVGGVVAIDLPPPAADPAPDMLADPADTDASDLPLEEAPFIAVTEEEEVFDQPPEPEAASEPVPVDEAPEAGTPPAEEIAAGPAPSDDVPPDDVPPDDAPSDDVDSAAAGEVTAGAEGDEEAIEEPAVPAFHSQRDPGEAPGEPRAEAGSRLATIVPRLGGASALAETEASTARVARLVVEKRGIAAPDAGLTASRPVPPRIGPPAWALPAGIAAVVAATALGAWALFLRDPAVEIASAPETVAAAGTAQPSAQVVTTSPDPAPAPAPRAVPDLPKPAVSVATPAPTTSAAADTSGAADLGADSPVARAKADPAGAEMALAGDPALPPQPVPPPFGTLLRYDASGSIIATPDGVMTPGGFTLIAGRPPRLPAARPQSITTAAQPLPTPAAEATSEEAPTAPPDPRVVGKQPRPRPASLAVPTPPADPVPETVPGDGTTPGTSPAPDDQTALPPPAPPVDPRHAARKPAARPDAILATAEARRSADEAIAEAAASAALAEAQATETALAAASQLAVASSRKPAPRSAVAVSAAAAARLAAATPAPAPVDSGAVEAALAEAQASAEPEPASAPAPADIDEPEPTEGIATLPTTRTVAKKSTFANAIDLGDINLIGVYGSSAARRALVRLPSGRYVKVKVGDRLDGGQVAAIGDNELRYVKKGKTLVLRIMDKG